MTGKQETVLDELGLKRDEEQEPDRKFHCRKWNNIDVQKRAQHEDTHSGCGYGAGAVSLRSDQLNLSSSA